MKKIIIAIVANVVITTTVIILLVIYAQNVYPINPIYNLKRVHEGIVYTLQLSPESKISYSRELLNKRLEEMEIINKSGAHQHLLITSLRYSTTAGKITNLMQNSDS